MTTRAASPALEPPPGEPRFPLMDALRGAGAVAVVFGHSYSGLHTIDAPAHRYADSLTEGITLAVYIFFALSGFLLFRPFLAPIARGERMPSVRAYARRRILRVVPAYWVALTLCGWLIPAGAAETFGDRWWVLYFFGQSYSLTDNYNGLAVAWTLSVDATFYVLLPLFVWLIAVAARRIGWERAAWLVIVPLVVIGPVMRVLNSIAFDSRELVEVFQKLVYAFPGEANFFAVGMGLAVLSVRGRPPRIAQRPNLLWALALALYLLTAWLFSFSDPYVDMSFGVRFMLNDLTMTVMVVLLMLPTVFDVRPGVPRTVLRWRPLAFVGIVAYGLYLWHVPLETWLIDHVIGGAQDWALWPRVGMTFAVVLAVSMVAATVSYYVIELPFLRLKEKRARRAAVTA